MASSHHAEAQRAHYQTGCRRHDQRRDANRSEPIPAECKSAGGDAEPCDRKKWVSAT